MKSIQLSFSSGEVSPEMVGRPDSRQYQSGAAMVRNFIPLPQGPAIRRQGSEFCVSQWDSAVKRSWLIPFVFSTDEALVLEFREGGIRPLLGGSPILHSTPRNVGSGTSIASSTFTFASEHGLAENDLVRITVDLGGALPTGVLATTAYYVNVIDSYTIKLGTTSPASASLITLSGATSGYVRIWKDSEFVDDWAGSFAYVEGTIVYWSGGGTAAAGFYRVKTAHTSNATDPGANIPGYLHAIPDDGTLIIAADYTDAMLPSLGYTQSNDIMTLVHPSRKPRELRRWSLTRFTLADIAFGSSLASPTSVTATPTRGARTPIVQNINQSGLEGIGCNARHGLGEGDTVYIEVLTGTWTATTGRYTVESIITPAIFTIKYGPGSASSGAPVPFSSAGAIAGFVYYSSISDAVGQDYKVTAVDSDGIETTPSAVANASNSLDVSGSYNTIGFGAVTGAEKYRVYKEENGVYGFIGETDTTTFVDDNISPDLGITPPIADDSLSGSDYPSCVAYFQQRRVFGGTTLQPRQIWMTKSGTESDLTYSLPVQDDDRISLRIASREAATIRHVVPLSEMMILTQQGEWRLGAVNSDAITPETADVRQQSEIGSSAVRPVVVNSDIVFAANRGGHLRSLRYDFQRSGFATTDLSLRASHLFDGLSIVDLAFSKSPYPIVWAVSSDGRLLSLTLIPEEEVSGWAAHTVGGLVETVCSVPEGSSDAVYIGVVRYDTGSPVRHIDRITPQVVTTVEGNIHSDAAVRFNGIETSGRTLTLSGGPVWTAGASVSIAASSHAFVLEDVGDAIELGTGTGDYRAIVTGFISSTLVLAKLVSALPVALRSTAISSWSWCRRRFSGLGHLEGSVVQIVADGVDVGDLTVIGGEVLIGSPAAVVTIGKGYTSELQTLPVTFQQIEGAGRGRTKNVQKAYLRVLDTAGLRVGPDSLSTVPVEGLDSSSLSTGERRAVVPGKWSDDGELYVSQSRPLPATILGVTLDIVLGD